MGFLLIFPVFLLANWRTNWHTWRTAIMLMKNSEILVKILM